jgi:zinc-binding alcohol dehydrogenase family protein
MRAFGYSVAGSADESLLELELPTPVPGPRDLRIAVRAVSVNPVDVKLRAKVAPAAGEQRVLGFDAAGIVEAVGSAVSLFKPGDEVFYAGALNRPGSNSEFQLIDERIVGRKPRTLTFSEAAALPLTSLTAWELLFDRLAVPYGVKRPGDALLIINGAGGVGSILIQLARRLTGLTVIATASRPETRAWCEKMGAHHVIDHHRSLPDELKRIGVDSVRYVAGLTATDRHLPAIESVLAPQGALAVIDDPAVLDITALKRKSISVHWELMFTRSLYETPDMQAQHEILQEVAALVDDGILRTTLTENAGPIDLATLKRVHLHLESARGIGKTVLTGFQGPRA